MNKTAAIYARVSSDRQKENHTIASQTAALIEYAQKNGYSVPPEWVFQDEGYSGAGRCHTGGSSAGAVSGHDRRIRTRPDCRAVPARQEAHGAAGRGERTLRSTLRLS